MSSYICGHEPAPGAIVSTWFCPACTEIKEEGYRMARFLGIKRYPDIVRMRDDYLAGSRKKP